MSVLALITFYNTQKIAVRLELMRNTVGPGLVRPFDGLSLQVSETHRIQVAVILYRLSSQDSTGSEYRALVSLPIESCELTL